MADEKLTTGSPAPTFTLPDQHGEPVDLADHRGHRVLVYFYPRADTPGCTTQACGLRDVLGDIGDTAVLEYVRRAATAMVNQPDATTDEPTGSQT